MQKNIKPYKYAGKLNKLPLGSEEGWMFEIHLKSTLRIVKGFLPYYRNVNEFDENNTNLLHTTCILIGQIVQHDPTTNTIFMDLDGVLIGPMPRHTNGESVIEPPKFIEE